MASQVRLLGYGTFAAVAVFLFALGTSARPDAASPIQVKTAPPTSSSAVASGNGITLHSVSVDLPASDRTFAGAEVLNDNCMACHSAGMVLNQPALTQVQWLAEVTHMRKDFKAPVDEADVQTIVAELVRLRGVK